MRRLLRRTLATAAATGLLGLGLPGGSAQASYPGDNGRIAFTDFAAGGQLYTIRPDGTGRRQLTHLSGPAFYPRWTSDGRRLIFNSFTNQGSRLFVVHADGSYLHRVGGDDPGYDDFAPAYSPDSRRIAFSRCRKDGEACALVVQNADGSGRRQLTPLRGGAFHVKWSPEGRYLAYTGLDKRGFLAAVYVRLADGTGPIRRITPPALLAGAPDWSPDGRRLLVSSDFCCGRRHSHVYVVNRDGTGLRQLTRTGPAHQDFFASYSPDGTRIVFSSDRAYPNPRCCADIWVMTASGAHLRRLTGGRGLAVFADWQPRSR